MLRHIIIRYQCGDNLSDGQGGANRNSNAASGSTSASCLTQRTCTSDQHPTPNRRRRKHQGQDDEDENNPGKRTKNSSPEGLNGRPGFLACPFWKSDPTTHWECFLKKLTTISYVKQHLARRHAPDFYCERCFQIFSNNQDYHGHMKNAVCQWRGASAKLDGITHQQSKQLSRKSAGSIQDQWFNMWNIIFPGAPPPISIFVDSDQSEEFCLMREFSQRRGASILREELQAQGYLLRPGVKDEEIERTLRVGLDSMFEYYRISPCQTASPSSTPTTAQPTMISTTSPTNTCLQSNLVGDPTGSLHGASQSTRPVPRVRRLLMRFRRRCRGISKIRCPDRFRGPS